MKNLIIESGMTLSQFANFYEIPYGTVRQWYTGERKPPSYIIKLIKMAAKGKQMEIPKHYITTVELEEGHEVSARLYPAEWIARKRMNDSEGIKMHLYEAHEIY